VTAAEHLDVTYWVAAARLAVRHEPVVSWELALRPRQDPFDDLSGQRPVVHDARVLS
jgi:hypothetical protein